MVSRSNKIFQFSGIVGVSPTTVSVQSTRGLTPSAKVEIFRSVKYQGTYLISNITSSSFEIDVEFDGDETDAAWQVSRARPVLVSPGAGESIDTLRQAVNQISADIGNKEELSPSIPNRRNLVEAINTSTADEALKSLLRSMILS